MKVLIGGEAREVNDDYARRLIEQGEAQIAPEEPVTKAEPKPEKAEPAPEAKAEGKGKAKAGEAK